MISDSPDKLAKKMAQRLENRTALITGANRGIGLAIARAYAREGARLLLAGRREDALKKVQAEIAAAGSHSGRRGEVIRDANIKVE